jgi:NAD(P)-dependent dehydrogenase (short-subunit alcohol dehydrogenase family)
MSNPVVMITGALTGIGRAAAVAFAKKGAKVVVAGRRDDAGKALVAELRSLGSEAEFINADVRKEDDVRALVDKTVARFGRLDVAVNNVATEGQVGPITDQTAETFAATFETNVLGVVLSIRRAPERALSRSARPVGTPPAFTRFPCCVERHYQRISNGSAYPSDRTDAVR